MLIEYYVPGVDPLESYGLPAATTDHLVFDVIPTNPAHALPVDLPAHTVTYDLPSGHSIAVDIHNATITILLSSSSASHPQTTPTLCAACTVSVVSIEHPSAKSWSE